MVSGKTHNMEDRPILIGITGGIGSGKSVVSRILTIRGYQVYDCDSRAKELMQQEPLATELRSIAGEEVFDKGGKLNRDYLASRLFSEIRLRRKVNSAVHSAVRSDIRAQMNTSKAELFFVESAIMSTSGIADMAKYIWIVEAPEDIRIARVLKRSPYMTEEDIRKRITTQRAEFGLYCLTRKYHVSTIREGNHY